MQTSHTRHAAALMAALALALHPATASAVLERVGPNSHSNFLPTWYQDTTGLTLEFCTPLTQQELIDGWCLILPADIPGGLVPEAFPNAFSGEHFYWASDVAGDWQYTVPGTAVTITSKVLLVQAIEGAFLGDIGPGLGAVFGRIRIRVLDLPLTGIYKFYTPWGIKEIAGLAGDRIFDTEDIGVNCAPFQYDCALETSIGPFLVPSNAPGGAELAAVVSPTSGALYLSDPARVGPVTGSPIQGTYSIAPVGGFSATDGVPTNPNVFAIEAPDGQVIFKSHDMTTMGRVYTNVIPSRIKADRSSYARDPAGAVRVDAFGTGEPTVAPRLPTNAPSTPTQPELWLFSAPCAGTTDPTGNLLPPYSEPVGETAVPMTRNGNNYFASSAPAQVPAGVCIKDANARTAQGTIQPTYTLGALGDQVFLTAAVFDPTNGGSLSVRASSSDQFAPPILSVGAFGTLTANVPLNNDLAFIAPLAAPPSQIRVNSQEGGSAELLVKVGSRVATGVTLTADRTSPQVPGTAVVFQAQGAGAAEYLYRFWLDSGTGFGATPVQDWSANPYWALSANNGAGHYRVMAEVWAGLSATPPDAASNIVTFDIREPPATGVTITADRTSPALVSLSPVPTVFTAAGQGSTAAYQYRFSLSTNGSAFVLVQDYGVAPSWTMPASTAVGDYSVKVDVRTSGLVDADASGTMAFQLVAPAPATGVLLVANPSSPQAVGTAITFSAQGQGGTEYQYRFWQKTGAVWTVMQDWSTTNTWSLPTNTPAGTYPIQVDARTSTTRARDAAKSMLYTLLANAPATGVTLAASNGSPSLTGTSIEFTATASGGTGAYEYEYSLQSGAAPATVVQPYGPIATWTMPASMPEGQYTVQVAVRTNATVARDVMTSIAHTLRAYTPATAVTLSSSAPSPQPSGTTVTFTAQGSGSNAPLSEYQYRFWIRINGAWFVVQEYGPSAQWALPSNTPVGSYFIQVDVRTSAVVARDVARTVAFAVQ